MPTWMTSTSADVFRGKRCWFAVPAGHVFNRTRAGDELDGDNEQCEERETMRKATRTLAIALLLAGSAALTAAAQTSRGASDINSAAQNFTPIEQVACRGWGPYCRPGFTRVCGPYRCWCRRCW
jgi:predicted small secreted protein